MAIIETGCALALCASITWIPVATANPIPEDVSKPTFSTYFYAYMDLDSAEEATKPLIRQARNIIIAQRGWVTEGVQGVVEDKDGNVIEELPQFYDIFPSDWEIPVFEVTEE